MATKEKQAWYRVDLDSLGMWLFLSVCVVTMGWSPHGCSEDRPAEGERE